MFNSWEFFLRYATKAAKPSACCAAGIYRYHPQSSLFGQTWGSAPTRGCRRQKLLFMNKIILISFR